MRLFRFIRQWYENVAVEGGISAIREALTEMVTAVLCVLGLIAVVMGGIEVHLQGKTHVVFLYVGAYLPVLAAFLLGRRIPHRYRISIVLVSLYLLAVLILGGVGLSGAGIILLATFCVLAAAFQGPGAGGGAMVMSMGAVAAVGWGMSSGLLPIDRVAMTNSVRGEAWAMALVLFFLVTGIMVLCISLLHYSLQKTINNLRETNFELEQAVTSHRQAEERVRESDTFHQQLFDESPTALYIQDFSRVAESVDALKRSGAGDIGEYLKDHDETVDALLGAVRILRANRAAVELYGAESAEQITAQGLLPLIPAEERGYFIDQVAAFTAGEDLYEGEARNMDCQDNVLDVIIRKTVLNRETNGLSRVLVSVVDVTALYRANRDKQLLERQLQQTRKLETIGTLAGGIAHDFNNILFPISGHAEMLMADLPEDSPHRQSVEQIELGTRRARDLVAQILAFARQDPGELKTIKVQHILTEALNLIRASIPATIGIRKEIDGSCPPVTADPSQIHQVIMNLCTNAWHAMEGKGGVLTVGLRAAAFESEGQRVCLTVKDTGTGISEENLDKIFDPFFTTKEQGRGTGMGLSVIHGIVSKMGGAVRVSSRVGRGSEFHIYFPPAAEAPDPDPARPAVQCRGKGEHLLIIDDEPDVARMEKKMLERLGYRVSTAAQADAALEMFQEGPETYDLVISDVAMPGMAGDLLASRLLEIRPDIPVLLCTGYAAIVTEARAMELGVKGLLTKPVSMADLSRAVRETLDGGITL